MVYLYNVCMLEALQLLAALYFLLLAGAAVWGVHRPILLLPARSLYAIAQSVLFLFSFGRIRLRPLRRKPRTSVREALGDFQEIQLEEVRSATWKRSRDDR